MTTSDIKSVATLRRILLHIRWTTITYIISAVLHNLLCKIRKP